MKPHPSPPHARRLPALLSALVLLILPGCLTTTPPSSEVHDTLSLSVDLHLQEEATAGKPDRWEATSSILWTPARLDPLQDNALFAQGNFALPTPLGEKSPLRLQANGTLTIRKENLNKQIPGQKKRH